MEEVVEKAVGAVLEVLLLTLPLVLVLAAWRRGDVEIRDGVNRAMLQ